MTRKHPDYSEYSTPALNLDFSLAEFFCDHFEQRIEDASIELLLADSERAEVLRKEIAADKESLAFFVEAYGLITTEQELRRSDD